MNLAWYRFLNDKEHAFLYCGLCIPLVALWVGWHQVEALPGCDCSGISHQGLSASCNAACPPTRRGGCSATEEYTSACPAAVGDLVAGATEISASEGEGRRERGYFVGVGSLNVKSLTEFPRRTRTGGRNPLRHTNNPFDLLAIFPVSVQPCTRMVRFVLASSTPELQLA